MTYQRSKQRGIGDLGLRRRRLIWPSWTTESEQNVPLRDSRDADHGAVGSDSLKNWEKSLGLSGQAISGGANVTVVSLTISSPERPGQDIVIDLTKDLDKLKKNPIVIKEGAEFSVSLSFRCNNSIVAGLTYLQVVKRAGIKVAKNQSMIGSFGPSTELQTKKFASEEVSLST